MITFEAVLTVAVLLFTTAYMLDTIRMAHGLTVDEFANRYLNSILTATNVSVKRIGGITFVKVWGYSVTISKPRTATA